MTKSLQRPSAGFTGFHMAAIMITFFGVIISVNFTMAWFASSSWSGLVVENTYVASQQFNGRAAAMRAMAASGIRGEIAVRSDIIAYDLRERDGGPATADAVTAHFKRPVGDHQDFQVALAKTAEGHFELAHPVLAGDWIVEVTSMKAETMVMHEAFRLFVKGE